MSQVLPKYEWTKTTGGSKPEFWFEKVVNKKKAKKLYEAIAVTKGKGWFRVETIISYRGEGEARSQEFGLELDQVGKDVRYRENSDVGDWFIEHALELKAALKSKVVPYVESYDAVDAFFGELINCYLHWYDREQNNFRPGGYAFIMAKER